ncbi:MAG TPA: hypothetical protein VG839_09525 [Asticcacaulis sp.]|nr:hypothetical protein [Asticcacaulis sp.]
MAKIDAGSPTLMRTFDLSDGGVVELYVWPTYLADDPRSYICPYRIEGLGSEKIRRVYGADPLEAFNLAMMVAGATLYSSDAYKAGDLTYLDSRDLRMPTRGDRPEFGDYEKADLLTSVGTPAIVMLPGERFASIAFPGWLFNGMAARVRKDTENLAGRDAEAYEIVNRTLKDLEAYQDYYERVCRSKGIDLAYKGPDAPDPAAEIPQE